MGSVVDNISQTILLRKSRIDFQKTRTVLNKDFTAAGSTCMIHSLSLVAGTEDVLIAPRKKQLLNEKMMEKWIDCIKQYNNWTVHDWYSHTFG